MSDDRGYSFTDLTPHFFRMYMLTVVEYATKIAHEYWLDNDEKHRDKVVFFEVS